MLQVLLQFSAAWSRFHRNWYTSEIFDSGIIFITMAVHAALVMMIAMTLATVIVIVTWIRTPRADFPTLAPLRAREARALPRIDSASTPTAALGPDIRPAA
jgi:hypothetical protein